MAWEDMQDMEGHDTTRKDMMGHWPILDIFEHVKGHGTLKHMGGQKSISEDMKCNRWAYKDMGGHGNV